MKHIVKTVSRFLLLSLTLGCGFFALKENNRSYVANYAETDSSEQKKTYTAADFADEKDADPEELEVTLVQSNTTSTSQSLNFSFKSKKLVAYSTAKNDFIVNIFDPAFTGKWKTPVNEGFDNFDEETGLPLLEGEVLYFVNASSSSRKNGRIPHATIPSTLTLDGYFKVYITTIGSECVSGTPKYDGKKGKSTWYDDDGTTLKYDRLYIPSTITTVHPNAFTDVPAGLEVYYEGSEIPSGFADNWIDRPEAVTLNTYNDDIDYRHTGVGSFVDDVVDESERSTDFCLGCAPDNKKLIGEQYNRPLVIQYDKVVSKDGVEQSRETIYEELPLTDSDKNPYDSVGDNVSAPDYSRLLNYKLGPNETIDDRSIVFHNIMKFDKDFTNGVKIDTSKRYRAKPISVPDKIDLSKLVSFKAGSNSTFAGYSLFSLTMDKILNLTSKDNSEPHSFYLDVKADMYEQNKTKIESGLTEIRYSLYNLYLSSYHFVYEGKDGQLKDILVPISSPITYQTLDNETNNKVSILLKNSDIADDFSAEKVRTFELVNITIQMDLLATSDSGSKSVLAKSQASYKFAYITIVDNQKINVFNWNLFLIIFCLVYVLVFTGAAFGLYKVLKEKFKNDEFRRINDKKYLKSAILYGLGSLVIAYAIIFISMRAGGFANTIVAFNPTDPLLIAFAIAGLIIGGYFIVLAIKAIKAEKERRKAIRLKLNEDVEDDGTK